MIQKINRINAARLFDVAKTQQCRENDVTYHYCR